MTAHEDDLKTRDRGLLAIVDAAMDEAARRAGSHLLCHPGCAVCCFGPFPITSLDAWRLRRGLAVLERDAPGTAREIQGRARAAVTRLRADFPGDPSSGVLSLAPDDELDFAKRFADLPCPALSPETGACLIHEHRPVACRLHGPPMVVESVRTIHCPLCFKDAGEAEVEACRVSLETRGAGVCAAAAWEAAGGTDARTTIAFALDGDARGLEPPA